MGRLFDIVKAAGEAARLKDWDALATIYADDVTAWAPTYEVSGREALIAASMDQNDSLEDIRQEMTLVVETDDTVVFEWTWSIPHPSGTGRATLTGLSYMVFDHAHITKVHQHWDTPGFMQQLEADTGVG